ncbi:MAG: putative membrane protein [Deltaproteobacteria bacterium]|nr:putative membrane protein [Deltaproteobacteria bacterium]
MNPDRLRRIRNWQSSEFYARLVMRPLTILVMLVVADWRWLTPNMVTSGANVAKLAGAVLLVVNHREHGVLAALCIQLGLLLDHLDGTLARYRQSVTTFGAFYDKVSDAVTWLAITCAVGWAAYHDYGDVVLPIMAVASAYALLVMSYMKWIVVAEQKKLDWLEARTQPPARRSLVQPSMNPPARTPSEWGRWFASSILRIVMFEEVDLFFWIGLGLVIDRLDWVCWLLAVSQGAQLASMLIKRGLQARDLDSARERLAASERLAA